MDARKFSPGILRIILRLVLVENRPIALDDYLHQANFGLLETCREMRDEGRAIYYSDNTFEVISEHYSRRRWSNDNSCWPEAPRIQFLQHVTIYTDYKSDMPGFYYSSRDVQVLKVFIIIEEVPEAYGEH
jgi:hypothetical protein